jgi:N-acetyl-gamma-glutamyl-phosphate/LysW-gamma-L-alpha-aminoadipyl-6-phosphate reductase
MNISIIGGSGYAGGELLRLLLQHPEVNVSQVISRSMSGLPVALPHPNLRGLTSLKFCPMEELKPCDLLFTSLPNGESMKHMPNLMSMAKQIVDLGADFRLHDPEDWKFWYGTEHNHPELIPQFVTGIPELYRDRIKQADHIAGPGCEAIVSILSLYPFLKNGVIRPDRIIIDAKMSSSQTGRRASDSTHHPERAGTVRSYKPTGHRHTSEIEQTLGEFMDGVFVNVSATAVEMVRGILVTIHAELLSEDINDAGVRGILRREYQDKPFIRIVKQKQGLYRYPEPKILQGSNLCEIGYEIDRRGNRIVILGAIDNLMKGTAGNAVQCMNLMRGFPEHLGLEFPGLHPV